MWIHMLVKLSHRIRNHPSGSADCDANERRDAQLS